MLTISHHRILATQTSYISQPCLLPGLRTIRPMKLLLQTLLPVIFMALIINYTAKNPLVYAQEASPMTTQEAALESPVPTESTTPTASPTQTPETSPTTEPNTTPSVMPSVAPVEETANTPASPSPDPSPSTNVRLNAAPIILADPSPSPSPLLAHLTFRTCLIPNTSTFRLQVTANYVAGEYRIVGQNTGTTINFGYLNVDQTAGSFTSDTYVIPEDTWKKQWLNGSHWQQAGGIPTTDVQQHIEAGAICGVDKDGEHTPYVTPSPSPSPVLPIGGPVPSPSLSPTPTPTVTQNTTPQPGKHSSLGYAAGVCEDKQFKVTMDLKENDTPVKDVEVTFTYQGATHTAKTNENGRAETWFDRNGNAVVTTTAPEYPSQSMFVTLPENCTSPASSNKPGVGGLSLPSTQKSSQIAAVDTKKQAAQILGATTLGYTGTADVWAAWIEMGAGAALVIGGIRQLVKKNS